MAVRISFLLAALLLTAFSPGCLRQCNQRAALYDLFWKIEDARVISQQMFEDNYYAGAKERSRVETKLRENLDVLDDAGLALEEIQEKHKPQTDELTATIQDMQSQSADIVELYIYEIMPRPRPRLAAVKETENMILEMYIHNRDTAARKLRIPDSNKTL
jgi:hypothetical protein